MENTEHTPHRKAIPLDLNAFAQELEVHFGDDVYFIEAISFTPIEGEENRYACRISKNGTYLVDHLSYHDTADEAIQCGWKIVEKMK